VTTTKRFTLKVAKTFFILAFAAALLGLFAFDNYLMIEGHRPYYKAFDHGFVYPIPGKGGSVYVSMFDLEILIGLVATVVISMICANRIDKALIS
jgi:hypothetical protein